MNENSSEGLFTMKDDKCKYDEILQILREEQQKNEVNRQIVKTYVSEKYLGTDHLLFNIVIGVSAGVVATGITLDAVRNKPQRVWIIAAGVFMLILTWVFFTRIDDRNTSSPDHWTNKIENNVIGKN